MVARALAAVGLVVWGLAAGLARGAAPEVALARGHEAQLPIVVAPGASAAVRAAADELAGMLGRISGGRFQVQAGDGSSGIAVGLASDFPALKLEGELGPEDFAAREAYVLRSHARGMYLVGRGQRGVENAVWDLLDRLGCRQFFPGKAWEVVPGTLDVTVAADTVQHPDYALRMIWFGWGTWPELKADMAQWERRNRAASAFELNTGHAYEFIVPHYKKIFDEHPEYYALVEGKRDGDKMCISNPAVRQLVAEYCLHFLKEHPEADSVSCEPSDGGGWCECDQCAAIGSPSDRALLLANQVAEAVTNAYPAGNKYVAMYAYYQHSPAPAKVKAHPNVIVSVATAFLPQGTPEGLIAGWKQAGIRQFGIREYYSVNAWDRDVPAAVNGGKIDYLRESIPNFHSLGARFMSAESGDNWGPYGLGYYLAARMLWDVKQAENIDALREDFLEKAFGPAASAMRQFYARIDGAGRPMLSADLVGRMYRDLAGARDAAGSDEPVLRRLDHLVLYTRYLELYRAYLAAEGGARQAAWEQLIRHAYRMRGTHMVHSLALWRDLPSRDKALKVPPEAEYDVPEPKNPWKSSALFERVEIERMLKDGIAANQPAGFEPISFSDKLVPASSWLKQKAPAGPASWQSRGKVRYATWLERAPAKIGLKVTGGLAGYKDRGDVVIRLFPAIETLGKAVSEARVPPDGQPRQVELETSERGLHWIEIDDNHDGTKVEWDGGRPWTSPLSFARRYDGGRQTLCFYVPRGTKVVGGFSSMKDGAIIDPAGKRVAKFKPPGEYFSIPVGPGQDGKLWQVQGQLYEAEFMLLTVPPYIARSGGELMLPEEVGPQRH